MPNPLSWIDPLGLACGPAVKQNSRGQWIDARGRFAKKPTSPHIDPKDIAGKKPSEIDKVATGAGLTPKGPNPMAGKGAYTAPVTGKQRVLVHPEPNCPHCHVNDAAGNRLDIDGKVVPNESPEAHLPLDTTP